MALRNRALDLCNAMYQVIPMRRRLMPRAAPGQEDAGSVLLSFTALQRACRLVRVLAQADAMLVQLRREASLDVQDAMAWYERERPGLGAAFFNAFMALTDRICEAPALFPLCNDFSPDLPLRRALMKGLPYTVLFVETPKKIIIVAVSHFRRRPDHWYRRFKS